MKYCISTHQTKRRQTREVWIGKVGVGGAHPIRIQSMTTSPTRDSGATIDQIMRLADAGCEIARVTVQGMREAEACEAIKNGLLQRGYTIPLVADIHFFPPAALQVADFVDKIRINPGNYVDKRASFKVLTYDDTTYAQELERLEARFTPLVEKCKRLGRALRIGTNHGSLSDRIMNRYGDTPEGMVVSALEFAEVCRKNDYHDLVFSMKSSNPSVMIFAYRLLVARMYELGWDYPLHLGVTEAGEGEEGRIKSAMGIGTLLIDGLGDTIRVSLTEDPWEEIDPCKRLVALAEAYEGQGVAPFIEKHRPIEALSRRAVHMPFTLSKEGAVAVTLAGISHTFSEEIAALPREVGSQRGEDSVLVTRTPFSEGQILRAECASSQRKCDKSRLAPKSCCGSHCHRGGGLPLSSCCTNGETPLYEQLGYRLQGEALVRTLESVDCLVVERGAEKQWARIQQKTGLVALSWGGGEKDGREGTLPLLTLGDSKAARQLPHALVVEDHTVAEWECIKEAPPLLILLSPSRARVHYARHFFDWLQEEGLEIPVLLGFSYEGEKEEVVVRAAVECGALLCDGLAEGLWIRTPHEVGWVRQLSFGLLQAARRRIVKTEFISCPGCGRTLFNIQEVAQRIRARTAHLPGVKIAIMGCIVNGPGEMADADFGYVGSKSERIDLYIGKRCVEKDIHFSEAEGRLVALIQQEGKWVDPV